MNLYCKLQVVNECIKMCFFARNYINNKLHSHGLTKKSDLRLGHL